MLHCSACEERATLLRANRPCCAACMRIRLLPMWEGAVMEMSRIRRELNPDKNKKGKTKR